MRIFKPNELDEAAKILANGGIVAFPTETVYGLGVVYNIEGSYKMLMKIKRRPPEKPFTLMLHTPDDIYKYARIDSTAEKLIKAFMPGPFTIILKARDTLPHYVVSSDGFVGIRVSTSKMVTKLIEEVGEPLLVPSANRSGEPTLILFDEVVEEFGDELDGIIEGECETAIPSTIVKVDNGVKIVRLGKITEVDIMNALEEK